MCSVLILHLAVKNFENRSIFCEAIDFRAKHPLFWPTLYAEVHKSLDGSQAVI